MIGLFQQLAAFQALPVKGITNGGITILRSEGKYSTGVSVRATPTDRHPKSSSPKVQKPVRAPQSAGRSWSSLTALDCAVPRIPTAMEVTSHARATRGHTSLTSLRGARGCPCAQDSAALRDAGLSASDDTAGRLGGLAR